MSTPSDDRRQNPNHLTGPRKSTPYDYKSDLKNDIAPVRVDLPLTALSRDAVTRWRHAMSDKGVSGKTVANKHGFLSSALNAAVKAGRIPSTPPSARRCTLRGPRARLAAKASRVRWLIRRRSYCR